MRGRTVFFIVLVIAVACIFAAPTIYETVMRIIYPVAHEDIIYECAKKNELDPYLVLGLIKAESNFVTDARSHKDAKGLMQLTDSTAQWVAQKMKLNDFDVSELNKPEVNIAIGCWYLRYLLDEYDNDLTLSLCAYNAGSGNVRKWLENEKYSLDGKTLDEIPFTETKNYVIKTKKYYQNYMKLYEGIF